MFTGVGKMALRTLNLLDGAANNQEMLAICPFSWSYTPEVEQLEAQGQCNGRRATVAAGEGETSYNVEIVMQFMNWPTFTWVMDQRPTTLTNTSMRSMRSGVVDAAGMISDPDITADDPVVVASISRRGPWGEAGPLTRIATGGTPAIREYTTANGQLQVNPGLEGATITYLAQKAYTSMDCIGGADDNSWGSQELTGVITGGPTSVLGLNMIFPQLDSLGPGALSYTGGVPEYTRSFQAITKAPDVLPYRICNLDGAVI